jgi:hypothetical protein
MSGVDNAVAVQSWVANAKRQPHLQFLQVGTLLALAANCNHDTAMKLELSHSEQDTTICH